MKQNLLFEELIRLNSQGVYLANPETLEFRQVRDKVYSVKVSPPISRELLNYLIQDKTDGRKI